jgi:hypothetical protein
MPYCLEHGIIIKDYNLNQWSQTCGLPFDFIWPSHRSYSSYRMWCGSVSQNFLFKVMDVKGQKVLMSLYINI